MGIAEDSTTDTRRADARRQPAAASGGPATGRVARRRARTQQRIVEVAEALVRARGVDAVTLDEIADAADIARRSFYHHFESKHALLVPIARTRTQALNRRIDRLIEGRADPAEVVAIGLRHTLRGFAADPLCAWFILHSGLPHDRLREGIGDSAARDLERGARTRRFHLVNTRVLVDLFGGAIVGTLSSYLAGTIGETDLDDVVEYALRVLGVPLREAHEIAHRPLPPLPEDRGETRAASPAAQDLPPQAARRRRP